ncbi:hypothetical protein J2W42_004673 [Rhizobium tibeticum]|uniref:Uncharacterized protein n=1 Tax=Rhizobium tibeticum TaxID=501024 RepID=A0A1H8QMS4_9HYPH|nr:hypothetical protein [Rhizobium tibeticum]SEI04089.1 hypothetical protein RTCCBAU85039_3916 [Rhizobium tibeticum]SEO55346.1 hypothetical protein SAMN05216228_101993 [Rhizobium tibeticum]
MPTATMLVLDAAAATDMFSDSSILYAHDAATASLLQSI